MTRSASDAGPSELHGLDTPAIVSEQEWNVAWNRMLAKEKAHSHARVAHVAGRHRARESAHGLENVLVHAD